MRLCVFLIFAVLAAAAPSSAGEGGVDDVQSARDHFAVGKRLYDLGRFADAAAEYDQAYRAKDDPALLFNLGQAYRLAHDARRALLAYKAYLRNVPDAPNRPEVEAHLTELQALVDASDRDARQSTHPPPPATPPAATAPPPTGDHGRAARRSGVAVAAVGVGVVGAGIAFAVLSKSAGDQAYHPSGGVYDHAADERQGSFRAADIACFVVGGAAVVVGTGAWLWGRHRRGDR